MKAKGKSIIQTVILAALGIVFVWFAYGQIEKNKTEIISAFTLSLGTVFGTKTIKLLVFAKPSPP